MMVKRKANTYLHLPGCVTGHPLGVHPYCAFGIAIESNRAKVNFVGKNGVSKQVLDAVEGVAVEEEHWFLCNVPSKGNLPILPVRHTWQYLDSTS